ncbi:hypothetical protein Tco_0738796 [Tanacetum coccineum]
MEGNDERVDDLNGQGNDQGMGANRGVEGVNGNVEGANRGAPDFSMIIAQQLQNLLPAMLAQVSNRGNIGNQNGNVVNKNIQENVRNVIVNGNRVGCSYKEFLTCNPKEYDGDRIVDRLSDARNRAGLAELGDSYEDLLRTYWSKGLLPYMGYREKRVGASLNEGFVLLFIDSRFRWWIASMLATAELATKGVMWLHLRPSKGTRSCIRDSVAYRRWRAVPLSTMYSPTISESSYEGYSSNTLDSSTEISSHSSYFDDAQSPSVSLPRRRPQCSDYVTTSPLLFVGPSRRRCRDSSAASSPEDSIEESMEVGSATHIDSDILADIKVDVAEAVAVVEVDAGVKSDVEEIHARRVTNIKEEQRAQEVRALADERERARLLNKVEVLKRDNMRLRGMLGVKRDRVDSVRRHIGYVQEELRPICLFRYYDRVDFRRLKTFVMRSMTITRYGMIPKAIEALIAQRVAKALAAQETNRNLGPIIKSESENREDDRNSNN